MAAARRFMRAPFRRGCTSSQAKKVHMQPLSNSSIPPSIAGTVYGVVLNDSDSLERIGAQLPAPPYKGAPKSPVLYIKPRTTFLAGGTVELPQDAMALEIGATIGLVIGAPAGRLRAEEALAVIGGYVVVADLSLPHASYYRPAIREKCFDGSCVIGSMIGAAQALATPDALRIETHVNGEKVDSWSLDSLVRTVPELLRDVTEFMTLRRGDMLLVGVKWQAPQAGAGERVRVGATGAGAIEFDIAANREGALA